MCEYIQLCASPCPDGPRNAVCHHYCNNIFIYGLTYLIKACWPSAMYHDLGSDERWFAVQQAKKDGGCNLTFKKSSIFF